MGKLFFLLMCIVICLLCSGCGSLGVKLGLSYQDYGFSIDIAGKSPDPYETKSNKNEE